MTSITSGGQSDAERDADVAPRGAKKKKFRPDIQGLRMLAVVAVIFDHLFGWPRGGFVGVDVFFVISGFLITGLLHREQLKTGRISFANFYRRRARRILPISTLVLLLTVAASYLIYLGSRAGAVAIDAVWTFFFVANWHFAFIGTDYWAGGGSVSPLQHYWSLAVEEQFYFVWPSVLVIVLLIATRRRWTAKVGGRALVLVLSLIIALSFVWALWQSAQSPGFSYFSTFVRAWELGLGGLIAVLAPRFAQIPGWLRPVLGWVGLVGIVVSIFLVDGAVGFPAPAAALPVLSTGLVIVAGTGGEQRFLFPLTNPVSNYLGDISYSLYLWHFPVITLLAVLMPKGPSYSIGAAVMIICLSSLSYHLLEEPIRRSAWLEPGRHERRRRPAGRYAYRYSVLPFRGRGVDLVIIGAATLTAAMIVGGVAIASGIGPRPISVAATVPAAPATQVGQGALSKDISKALQATKFPTFDPPLDTLGTLNWVHEAGAGGCADVNKTNIDKCRTGQVGSAKNVAVLGDSFAIAWLPGIKAALEKNFRISSYTMGQCPAATVEVTKNKGEPFPDCSLHRAWALQQIEALKPDLVILADSAGTLDRLVPKVGVGPGSKVMAAGIAATIKQLAPYAGKVAVLSDPPVGASLQDCVTRFASPADCSNGIPQDWFELSRAEKASTEQTGALYIDTHLWFCDENAICPGFVGSMPVRADGAHLTVKYSESLAPLLLKTLTGE